MRNTLVASVFALAAAVPGLAAAEGLSISAGATVASKYVSDGTELSNGPAFQPWMEAEFNGLYFGVWGSNVAEELNGGNTWESDVYVGYRNSYAGLNYDLSYYRYYMNKTSGYTDEAILALSYDFNDQYSLGAQIGYDPSNPTGTTTTEIFAGYNFDEKLSFEARAGKKSQSYEFYTLGASYALNDDYALSLAYTHKSGTKSDVAVLALDYAFSFK